MTRSNLPGLRDMLLGRARPGRDASLLIAGPAARAAGYGFTAVLLGALLAAVVARSPVTGSTRNGRTVGLRSATCGSGRARGATR